MLIFIINIKISISENYNYMLPTLGRLSRFFQFLLLLIFQGFMLFIRYFWQICDFYSKINARLDV